MSVSLGNAVTACTFTAAPQSPVPRKGGPARFFSLQDPRLTFQSICSSSNTASLYAVPHNTRLSITDRGSILHISQNPAWRSLCSRSLLSPRGLRGYHTFLSLFLFLVHLSCSPHHVPLQWSLSMPVLFACDFL